MDNQSLAKIENAGFGLVVALKSPLIRNVERIKIDGVVQPAVFKAFMDRGQFEIEQEKIDHIVSSLSAAILKICPNIRLEEIPIAIEKGTLGEFGDYMGINVATLTKFIKTHYMGLERFKLVSQSYASLLAPQAPNEAETIKIDQDLLLKAFEKYKTDGFYEDHGNYLYKVVVKKLVLFTPSEEGKKTLLERGKRIAYDKIKLEILKCNKYERNKLLNVANDVINLVPHSEGIKRVYKEALQLALNDWFKNLLEMEMEISELFD